MADTTVTIRVDEKTKKNFEEFCEDVGMNMSVAVNIFIRAVLKERKIPFEIASDREKAMENFMKSVEKLQAQSVKNGTSEMTMEEIDAEIALARKERKVNELN